MGDKFKKFISLAKRSYWHPYGRCWHERAMVNWLNAQSCKNGCGFLFSKKSLLDWRHGERWFWDCLVDADLASNSASWQWVAGCGADAAPYFRIFNPVTQGEKFDPDGEYIREYIPELKDLPNKFLYSPWEAPKEILETANIVSR